MVEQWKTFEIELKKSFFNEMIIIKISDNSQNYFSIDFINRMKNMIALHLNKMKFWWMKIYFLGVP